jgi:hypothetical protein
MSIYWTLREAGCLISAHMAWSVMARRTPDLRPGNNYLEVQVIAEVFDARVAEAFGFGLRAPGWPAAAPV